MTSTARIIAMQRRRRAHRRGGHTVFPNSKEPTNASQEELRRSLEEALELAERTHPATHVIGQEGNLLRGPDFDELVAQVDRGGRDRRGVQRELRDALDDYDRIGRCRASAEARVGARRNTPAVSEAPRGVQAGARRGGSPATSSRALHQSRRRETRQAEELNCDTPWAMLALTIVAIAAAIAVEVIW